MAASHMSLVQFIADTPPCIRATVIIEHISRQPSTIDPQSKHMYSISRLTFRRPTELTMESSQHTKSPHIIGRGSPIAPPNRFESVRVEADLDQLEFDEAVDDRRIATEFFADATQSLITSNDSPDIP